MIMETKEIIVLASTFLGFFIIIITTLLKRNLSLWIHNVILVSNATSAIMLADWRIDIQNVTAIRIFMYINIVLLIVHICIWGIYKNQKGR